MTVSAEQNRRGAEHPFLMAAALHLALAGGVVASHGSALLVTPLEPLTVASVHLLVLGVVTIALTGLGLRALPHLLATPLPWPGLNPWTLGSWILGVLTLFLGIGTSIHPWMLLFASAGVGLGCGFFLLQSARMLWLTPRRDPLAWLLRLAFLALTGVFLLGAFFLGEYAHGFLPYDRLALLGTHLTWGLFGWAALSMLAGRLACLPPDPRRMRLAGRAVPGAAASLLLIPPALFLAPGAPLWLWAAATPGLLALVTLTLATRPDDNPYGQFGDLLGAFALPAILAWPVSDDPGWRFLFGFLFLPGWGLSQLFALYAARHPGRPGRLHERLHLAGATLPPLALMTGWGFLLPPAGVAWILSALLFARDHLRETPPMTAAAPRNSKLSVRCGTPYLMDPPP